MNESHTQPNTDDASNDANEWTSSQESKQMNEQHTNERTNDHTTDKPTNNNKTANQLTNDSKRLATHTKHQQTHQRTKQPTVCQFRSVTQSLRSVRQSGSQAVSHETNNTHTHTQRTPTNCKVTMSIAAFVVLAVPNNAVSNFQAMLFNCLWHRQQRVRASDHMSSTMLNIVLSVLKLSVGPIWR